MSGADTIRWQLQDITEQKRAEVALDQADYDPCCDRPVYSYNKGELILLDPQVIWLVSQGGVKLTTLSDSGEEVLGVHPAFAMSINA